VLPSAHWQTQLAFADVLINVVLLLDLLGDCPSGFAGFPASGKKSDSQGEVKHGFELYCKYLSGNVERHTGNPDHYDGGYSAQLYSGSASSSGADL